MTRYDRTMAKVSKKPFDTFRESRIKRTTSEGKVAITLKCNTSDTKVAEIFSLAQPCLLYTSPSPRDATLSRMPSSA